MHLRETTILKPRAALIVVLLLVGALFACNSGAQPEAPPTDMAVSVLQSRGYETATIGDRDRVSVHRSVIQSAYNALCSRGEIPSRTGFAVCDDISHYRWHVFVESNRLLSMEFTHINIETTTYVASFGCIFRTNIWECNTVQD